MNPEVLVEEVSELEERWLEVRGRPKVDGRTYLILPHHILLDGYREKALGKDKVASGWHPGPERRRRRQP